MCGRYADFRSAQALADADIVEAWLHRTREFAHAEAVAGRVPPGWKLVAKRATRKWKDADKAIKSLTVITGVEDEHLYERKFQTPAKMEKVLKQHYGFKGKKAGEEIADLVEKVSSGVVLAPESDARPAVRPGAGGGAFYRAHPRAGPAYGARGGARRQRAVPCRRAGVLAAGGG